MSSQIEEFMVGQYFPDRRALYDAGVHRALQAGIVGTAEHGVESIVVSGGYEDDEDYGDELVYTGQGGRNQRGQQVRDQTLTLGNAALMTSRSTGAPVRVVRGARGDPAYSPAAGLRYDGLYVVEDAWHEAGCSGHLVWRFRLHNTEAAQPMSEATTAPAVPEGNPTPTRSTATIQRVVRRTAVADFVKQLHDHTCQVCGLRLLTPTGAYAEAAHIRPLGRPHLGPDVVENVLCLCPNHHVLFDLGMLIVEENLRVYEVATGADLGALRQHDDHPVSRDHVRYHRDTHQRSWGVRLHTRPRRTTNRSRAQ